MSDNMDTVIEQANSSHRCDHYGCNRIAHLNVYESSKNEGKPYWICKFHWEGMMRDNKTIVLKSEVPQDTEVEESCG